MDNAFIAIEEKVECRTTNVRRSRCDGETSGDFLLFASGLLNKIKSKIIN